MTKIIDGKKIAEQIKDDLVKKIIGLKNERPNLAIILVGEREDSKLYVRLKEEEAKKIGIDTHIYKCPENISEKEILETIDHLNKDELIDAILVQLPLPENFNTDKIIAAIDPNKDVDRFHPENLQILMETCSHQHVMPPVLEVILEILKNIDYDLSDKKVCLVVNSDIFGQALKQVLSCQHAEVEITSSDNPSLSNQAKQADLLITAVGRPGMITKEMIKKDAVVIDVGINKQGGRVCGDVDLEGAMGQAGYITPVPGGVGPLTIAMLFKNTLDLYSKRREK